MRLDLSTQDKMKIGLKVLRSKLRRPHTAPVVKSSEVGVYQLPLYLATVDGVEDVLVQDLRLVHEFYCVIHSINGKRFYPESEVTDVLPAIVLDSWEHPEMLPR